MRRFNKLICLLTALVLCLLSVSCGVISSEDGDYKIISSDELSVLAEAATVDFSNPENSKVTLGAYGGKALGWTVVNVDREGVATLSDLLVKELLCKGKVRNINKNFLFKRYTPSICPIPGSDFYLFLCVNSY